jgi:lactoylglutathione lyase
MTVETSTQITDVRTVGVPVSDQDRALEFYVGKLGLEKRLEFPMGDGQRWIEVAPPGATTTIALVLSTPAYGSQPVTPMPTTLTSEPTA